MIVHARQGIISSSCFSDLNDRDSSQSSIEKSSSSSKQQQGEQEKQDFCAVARGDEVGPPLVPSLAAAGTIYPFQFQHKPQSSSQKCYCQRNNCNKTIYGYGQSQHIHLKHIKGLSGMIRAPMVLKMLGPSEEWQNFELHYMDFMQQYK